MTKFLSNELYINDLKPFRGIGFSCGRREKRGERATS